MAKYSQNNKKTTSAGFFRRDRDVATLLLVMAALILVAPLSNGAPVPGVVSPATATLSAGQSMQFSTTLNGFVVWAISPPAGTITRQGLYTAPPSITLQQKVSVIAISTNGSISNAQVTLSPGSTSGSVSVTPGAATLGASQTQQFTATVTGLSSASVVWTLSPSVGTISAGGFYTAPATLSGTQTVTVKATSAVNSAVSGSAVITLNGAPSSVTVSPAATSVATGKSVQYSASGGSGQGFKWGVNGISGGNSQVGTITSQGLYTAPATLPNPATVTIAAVDSGSSTQGTAAATITPSPSGLTITTSTLPNGSTGVAYNASLAASGGTTPYSWSIQAGQLPQGLGLSTTNGTISGTPTTSGSYNVTVRVTDAAGTIASASFAFAVAASLTITTLSIPSPVAGAPYNVTLAATGGTTPYAWTVASGQLPTGLSLSSSGSLSGTPSASGSFAFTAQVTDAANGSSSQSYAITISSGGTGDGTLTITNADLPNGTAHTAYAATLSAIGGTPPYSWSIINGMLPAGISLSSSGVVSGTPTSVGWSGFFTVRVTDHAGKDGTLQYSMLVRPSLDLYGGRNDTSCSGTGFFHAVKIGSRWWLCSPSGHLFFMAGVSGITPDTAGGADANTGITNNYPALAMARYGDLSTNWASAQLKRMNNWGFNTVGQQSAGATDPTNAATATKVPALSQAQTIYAASNAGGYWSEAVKDIQQGVGPVYGSNYRAHTMDFFDPKLWTGFHAFIQNVANGAYKNTFASPWIIGVMGDDTDWLFGFGAGPDFPGVGNSGATNVNLGWWNLVTAPEQTYNPNARFTKQLYMDRMVYSKAHALNPSSCSIASPCSLRDYLKLKYTTIGALNTAWNTSNFYTSFDSTGVRVTETIGIGDGSKRQFTYNTAHAPVSPDSVQVIINGTVNAGDCPWFAAGCPNNPARNGAIESIDGRLKSGDAAYPGGEIFFQPSSGFPVASWWYKVVYHYGDGRVGTAATYKGASMQTPNQQPVGTSPIPSEGATGYDIYWACRLIASSTASHGCVGNNQPIPPFRLQASNIPIGQNWAVPSTGLVSGATEPTAPNKIDYSTGAVSLMFGTPPAAGAQIQISYVYNGWMSGGRGLMDEDGSHSWVGTNPFCLEPSSYPTFVCDGVNYQVPNANPTLGRDLNTWVMQFSAKYHKQFKAEIASFNPNMMFLGVDTTGAWGVPPAKEVLQGLAPYVDIVHPAWAPPTQSSNAQATLNYFDQWAGKPMFTSTFIAATPDSFLYPYYGNTASDKGTQEKKGQFYHNTILDLINTRTALGNNVWIGANWWGLLDFWSDGTGSTSRTNWGLISSNDNPYDGKSSCSVSRRDPLGFATIPETSIPTWQAGRSYSVDAGNGIYPRIQPTRAPLGLYQMISGSGVSGNVEPQWCTTAGCSVNDNGITWQYLGPKSSAKCFGDAIDFVKQANALWWSLVP